MLTSDDKYWSTLTEKQVKSNAKLWSKQMTTKRLETFIDWYRSLQEKESVKLTEAEKHGIVTDRTQSIQALHNRERVALIARFMREYPKEKVPSWL
jgi:hypothetical protein